MNPNEGAATRYQDRHAPIRVMKEPPPGEHRLRRMLAALAISALAVGGVTTLAAAPAAADDAVAVVADGAEVESTEDAAAGMETSAEEPSAPAPDPAPPAEEPAPAPAPAEESAPVEEPAAVPSDETVGGETSSEVDGAVAPAAAVEASDMVALLVPPGDEVVDKVEICHATSSYKNPYVINEPAADGDVSGHADHTGPVFSPDIPKHTSWGDIIPPFYYDGGGELPSYFPGLNWDEAGQAIYENDCVIPTPVPVLTITPSACPVYASDGALSFTLGPVQPNVDYRLRIMDEGGILVEEILISGEEGTIEDTVGLPPGDYSVTLEQSIIDEEWELLDEQFFTIGACPELGIGVLPGECVIGAEGTATVTFTGLIVGESYDWDVFGEGVEESGSFTATAETEDVTVEGLPPGNFVALVFWDSETLIFDWVGFVIEPCQPEITVEVTECPAAGGTGSALLTLSNLVAGVEYEVKVTDRGDASGTPYGGVHVVMGDEAGNAQLMISSLPADHEYTAWVDGIFEATWEEPWWSEGSDFEPIDTVELSASVDFALQPCPAVPVTPAKVVPAKALPATGADGIGELLLTSMLLFGLGGASLIAARRRHSGDQHVS